MPFRVPRHFVAEDCHALNLSALLEMLLKLIWLGAIIYILDKDGPFVNVIYNLLCLLSDLVI